MKQAGTDVNSWEDTAWDRDDWRAAVKNGVVEGKRKRRTHMEERRKHRKEAANNTKPTTFICMECICDCR